MHTPSSHVLINTPTSLPFSLQPGSKTHYRFVSSFSVLYFHRALPLSLSSLRYLPCSVKVAKGFAILKPHIHCYLYMRMVERRTYHYHGQSLLSKAEKECMMIDRAGRTYPLT